MELSDSWQVFVDTEFNVFEITLYAALLYLGIAVLCWLVIPASGPVLLKGGYFKNIEQYSYDDNGVANIVRILFLSSNRIHSMEHRFTKLDSADSLDAHHAVLGHFRGDLFEQARSIISSLDANHSSADISCGSGLL